VLAPKYCWCYLQLSTYANASGLAEGAGRGLLRFH
jgi:hypothetical protein